jgi:catecholate siderophore receptor
MSSSFTSPFSSSIAYAMLGGIGTFPLIGIAQTVTPSKDAQALPEITVKANRDAATRYKVDETRTGKTLQNPHDVPQAITTLPRELLTDQQAGNLKEHCAMSRA